MRCWTARALIAVMVMGLGPAALPAAEATVRILEPWTKAESASLPASLKAMSLAAPRNGFASGLIHIDAPAEIKGVTAVASDLKGPEGATLAASAVRIRYGKPASAVYGLFDAPLASAKTQVVWVTVNVPADAKPGDYAGSIELRGLDRAASAPVELRVFGWKVASPRDWKTSVNFLQSPESVAGTYSVPLWSDAHFKLIESTFQLMADGGNDVLGINLTAYNYCGDDPVLVFRKEGGRHIPEFKYLDRYLESYNRIVGKPKFLCLQVWNWPARGPVETGNEPVAIKELQGDKLVSAELPAFGSPGTEDLWRTVFDGIRQRVRKLGWREEGILLGTSGDSIPLARTVDFFNRVAPGLEWRSLTHGTGCPKWGPSRGKRTQPGGMVVGYLEIARWVPSRRGFDPDHPVASNSRDHIGLNPFDLFALPAFNASGGYWGYCWKGLDYWTYTTPQGTRRSALNTYTSFGNVIGSTPRALAAVGPAGAMTSPQLQMLREGTQACEAVYAIRDNIAALYPAPSDKFDVVELFLHHALRRADNSGRGSSGGAELEVTLVFQGDKILVMPYAPRWNTGGVGAGQAKVTRDGDRATFQFDFTLKDDQWVPGGSGSFTVQATLADGNYTGTYKGSFKGVESSGSATGTFRAKGYVMATGPAPARTDLWDRAEAAIADFFKQVNLDGRKNTGPAREPRPSLVKLYDLATETAQALEARGR